MMIHFLYSIITRGNSVEANLSPEFWDKHPDWQYFVRTNVRYSKRNTIWLGGGGETMDEALAAAKESIIADHGKSVYGTTVDNVVMLGPVQAEGKESPVMIKN